MNSFHLGSIEVEDTTGTGANTNTKRNENEWRARRDSNSRPTAPEAAALSS
jgi:hypothetical protein